MGPVLKDQTPYESCDITRQLSNLQ